jgi:hypothetical protein
MPDPLCSKENLFSAMRRLKEIDRVFHPSVRHDDLECLDAKRREGEYAVRE